MENNNNALMNDNEIMNRVINTMPTIVNTIVAINNRLQCEVFPQQQSFLISLF